MLDFETAYGSSQRRGENDAQGDRKIPLRVLLLIADLWSVFGFVPLADNLHRRMVLVIA